jgi:16S rRNA (cytosine967-C5)-methyltransferase
MPISPARVAAFEILLRVERENAYASELLHSARYSKLSPADHGLAMEVVMGVLRWRSLLDAEIARFSSQKIDKLDPEVLTALRMATFQIAFLDRVPARAAVHESVELVKHARKRSAAAFANALLRKVSDHIEWAGNIGKAIHELDRVLDGGPSVARPTVVVPPQQFSPARRVQYFSERYAHPLWLVQRWAQRYGVEVAGRIACNDQAVPTTSIVLPARAVESALQRAGIVLLNGKLLKSAARVESGDLTERPEFRSGRVAIQDEASQLVALLVGKGSKILDCCAAPGGKTRLLAERNASARITAVELHPHRARLLRKLVPAKNVEVIQADVRELTDGEYDRVLVDVPCSGTGTLARNPEIKWRLKPEDLIDLHDRQLQILRSALRRLKPGGRLVYSSCSLEQEENEEVVEEALADNPSIQLIECRSELERLRADGDLAWTDIDSLTAGPYLRTIPGIHPCDGFFAAIVERRK